MNSLQLEDIQAAQRRIASSIKRTPLFSSHRLNEYLGHSFYFKAENLQRVGAFKARGAMNTLLWLKERGDLPKKVVAYSSGNHAQAVSWAAQCLGVSAEIFMPGNVSQVKLQATRAYGAHVSLCKSRQEAEARAADEVKKGAFLIPPFDHDQVICGQGTACLEALTDLNVTVDAVFTPCGGGGLTSGTVIAAKGFRKETVVIGAEPTLANDAVRTLKSGEIFRWEESPPTLADGVRTLSVTERTLQYLKRLDGLSEISEKEIAYWTQWLCHLLKLHCEPTAALGMAAAHQWLATQNETKNVLVVLTGGNMDRETVEKIWQTDHLCHVPSLRPIP